MEREQFSSRLGFLLIAAGCAIGLGNVWRFPYITGLYGGAVFVLVYLGFLICVGMPILTMELAVGRASRRSLGQSFEVLTPGKAWRYNKYWMILGNYVLMAFYSLVTGWMLYYAIKVGSGSIGTNVDQGVAGVVFNNLLASPGVQFICALTVIVGSFAVCALGFKKGVERITKPMMILLFILLFFMALRSFTLDGFSAGIDYYLKPDWSKLEEHGIMEVLWAAMGQSFFTLSVGQGSIQIFGTYMDKKHTLMKEATFICGLDTTVALLAGVVIFPACFSYGVQPDAGPSLLFVTLTTVFSNMSGGAFWGGLFFLFMLFAAVSTLIAVFESIIAMFMDLCPVSRVKAVVINFCIIMVLAIPPLLGYNVLDYIHPLGGNSTILDFQDFLISNNILPGGSLLFVLFITWKTGWGFKNYLAEANTGVGPKIPMALYWYYKFVMPVVIAILLVAGYVNIFG